MDKAFFSINSTFCTESSTRIKLLVAHGKNLRAPEHITDQVVDVPLRQIFEKLVKTMRLGRQDVYSIVLLSTL